MAAEPLPEKVAYMKYYEHDGMLRAYANRAMVATFLFALIAVVSLGFAIWVRLQPPTIIRVSSTGEATVVGEPQRKASAVAASAAPSDIEGRALAKRFLETYHTYTPTTVDRQFADSLNFATWNFRQHMMTQLREQDTVGKIKDEMVTSSFKVRSIEPVRDQPWSYVAIGVKEVTRLRNKMEVMDRIVGRYTVRLVEQPRSERVPNGLLVAESREWQLMGEKAAGLDQKSNLLNLASASEEPSR